MELIVCEDYEKMSARAAEIVANTVSMNPHCVLGLATGSTPVGMYQNLIEMYREGELTFAEVTTVNLDEYYPISPDNDQSYRYFMNTNFFDHIDVDKSRTYVPDGNAVHPQIACIEYEDILCKVGKPAVQILGIGQNGHIGFNEPADALEPATHVTDLTESTIKANARFFASEADVPTKAITMGMGTILFAQKIVILASGESKADAVAQMLSGKIDPHCPASLLNLHPHVTAICDWAALKKYWEMRDSREERKEKLEREMREAYKAQRKTVNSPEECVRLACLYPESKIDGEDLTEVIFSHGTKVVVLNSDLKDGMTVEEAAIKCLREECPKEGFFSMDMVGFKSGRGEVCDYNALGDEITFMSQSYDLGCMNGIFNFYWTSRPRHYEIYDLTQLVDEEIIIEYRQLDAEDPKIVAIY